MEILLPQRILDETFHTFRECGSGRRECQVLWLSPWHSHDTITATIHTTHRAKAGGYVVDDKWLSTFWMYLLNASAGIRVQVHTHPGAAFHSAIDDEFPIINAPGFLSLVIPNFALGPIGFHEAFLAEIGVDGCWRQVSIDSILRVVA